MVNDEIIVVYIKMDKYKKYNVNHLGIQLDEGSMYCTGKYTCFDNK